MKEKLLLLALCGLILGGFTLTGCRSEKEDTQSKNDGGVVNSAISSVMSKVSDVMEGSSLLSDSASDTDEELTSPVFWEAPRYY